MGPIEIEFLVGLFVFATSIDGDLKSPSVHVVRLIIGVILIALAVFNVNLLTLR